MTGELCELEEEASLPDMYHIGMPLDKSLLREKLGAAFEEDISFDTWNKAKVDSYRTQEYWEVVEKARKK